jgi:hypothetical protein
MNHKLYWVFMKIGRIDHWYSSLKNGYCFLNYFHYEMRACQHTLQSIQSAMQLVQSARKSVQHKMRDC